MPLKELGRNLGNARSAACPADDIDYATVFEMFATQLFVPELGL